METSRSFFPNVVTTHTWEERKETLDNLRAVAIKQTGTVTIVAKDLTRETIMLRGLAIVQIIITAMNEI